jgi:ankyrin repeat protein
LVKYNNDDCTDNDVYRYTPLIVAAMNGRVLMVRVLLDGGVKVDSADAYGRTALHKAALIGRLDICRLLLDRGAKVDHLDMEQYTPLLHAAEWGHLSVVKLLVERGADVCVKNDDGRTASDVARSKGKQDVARWLDSIRRG